MSGWKMTAKEVLNEIHLYADKREALIRDAIWGVSFIGVLATTGSTDKRAIASAFFVFSLSLLMEFYHKIIGMKCWLSRLVNFAFTFSIVAVLLLSVSSLVGVADQHRIMFGVSVAIMVFIALDCAVTWIGPERIKVDNINDSIENKTLDEEYQERKTVFQNKLNSGALGNIDLGENKNG